MGSVAAVRVEGIESTPNNLAETRAWEGAGGCSGPPESAPSRKVQARCCGDTFAWSGPGRPRAFSSGMMLLGGSAATAQTPAPAPAAARAEPSAPPAEVATETVDLLQARKAGDLTVAARGQGQDKVRMTLRNTTKRRLNVIVPPGLVAASKVAQAGAGGGGRGMQSIGLGSVANREGAFGEFQADEPAGGLRSIPTTGEPRSRSVAVPAGESVDLTIPGVCLNYGLPAPTGRDTLTVMDVDEYTTDPRIRKALRTPRDARHQPRRRPGGDVAGLQRPPLRGDDGAIRQGHEPVGDRPGRPVRRGPRRVNLAGAARAVRADRFPDPRPGRRPGRAGPRGPAAQWPARRAPRAGLAAQGRGRRDATPLLRPGHGPARRSSTEAKAGETRGRIVVTSCAQAECLVAAGPRRVPREFVDLRAWTVPSWPAPSIGPSPERSSRSSRHAGPSAARR